MDNTVVNKITTNRGLYNSIRQRIDSGELRGKLPSISDFIRESNLSDGSVKKALSLLKHDGIIYGVKGKGFFVNEMMNENATQSKVLVISHFKVFQNSFYLRLLENLKLFFDKSAMKLDIISDMKNILLENYDAVIILENYTSEEELEIICHRVGCQKIIRVHGKEDDLLCVGSDETMGGYAPLEELYKAGHRNIGVLTRNLDSPKNFFHERNLGVEKFIKAHNNANVKCINIDNTSDFPLNFIAPKYIIELLDNNPEISAIFTFTDELALYVYAELSNRNLKVPNDISIVSHDNRDFSSLVTPQLSSFDENAPEMAKIILDLCEKIITQQKVEIQHIKVPLIFIERSSIKNINNET